MTEKFQPAPEDIERWEKRYGSQETGYQRTTEIWKELKKIFDRVYDRRYIDKAFAEWPADETATDIVRRAESLLHSLGKFVQTFPILTDARKEVVEKLVEDISGLFNGESLPHDIYDINRKLSALEMRVGRV